MEESCDWRQSCDVHRSLRERVVLKMLLLVSTVILLLIAAAMLVAHAHLRQRVLLQLASESTAKEDLIEQRLQHDWERVSQWSKRSDIRTLPLEQLLLEAQEEGVPITGMGILSTKGELLHTVGVVQIGTGARLHAVGGSTAVFDERGWVGNVVLAPLYNARGDVSGFLAAQFDMTEFVHAVFSVADVGQSAEMLLGKQEDGELLLLHHRYAESSQLRDIGSLQSYIHRNDPLARAVLRQEGVIQAKNYEGRDVLAAYRFLPRLGWGLVLTIDANEAMIGVWAIAMVIGTVGLLLLGMAILLSVSFATKLTKPLLQIATQVNTLGPGAWNYTPSLQTDDELQMLDLRIGQMASRLQELYGNLEKEVQIRTREVREQYELDKAILRSTLHGVLVVAPDGRIMSMNPSAQNTLGYHADACAELFICDILALHRKNHPVPPAQHPVMQCLHTRKAVEPKPDVRWSVPGADGSFIAISLAVSPVFDGDRLLGAVAVFRDVTEERHVDELKSEFISLASHQLRTPLSVVKWYSELLEDATGPESKELPQKYVEEIAKAGEEMSNLVDALLQAAQLESHGIMAEKREVAMNAFIQNLSAELHTITRGRSISCEVHVPEEKITLLSDPILLHIVLQNLYSNAVKYTKDGGVVSISLRRNHGVVEIEVQDTGIGIPKSAYTKIFQRLFRAENVKKIEAHGSGLGLYISKMIMDILGGEIAFESKENAGTTFLVRFAEHIQKEQQ